MHKEFQICQGRKFLLVGKKSNVSDRAKWKLIKVC